MNNYKSVLREIKEITNVLVEKGISANQNYPINKNHNDKSVCVEWSNISNLSIALKNREYREIYNELDKNRDYNIKLLDGALIHFMYKFKGDELISHRLAFYPSPYLENYQNEPELYERDEIYADVIYKNIVAFPIRFDYNKDEVESEYYHPKSHVTLGQYKNCRIPAYGPISPVVFIKFIFKNFYSKVYYVLEGLESSCNLFSCIEPKEEEELHFNIKNN
ncbi:DUF2290 domain-containing protein [Clostridium perfringens]|uniref:DUF2290 domain-containing protein n=1 Tax=Clostridium perfringens TaxID=1502 RepID=UPI0024BD1F87|nr:DUF2290 domain-containing protein [Clostridium perfringens]